MSIQAMKQALEVLEKHLYFKDEPAITALRAAIEAEERQEPVATVYKRGADRTWMSEKLGALPDGKYSLYTTPQPAIPAGYALVPVEPTPEMLDAMGDFFDGDSHYHAHRLYKAMIAAAPKPENGHD